MFIALQGFSQLSLPIDFESGPYSFEDFDGGSATVLANPQSSGINTSAMVAQIVRDGGATWSGSKLQLANKIDFSNVNAIRMKVYSTKVDVPVLFKLEGDGAREVFVNTTVANEWETLTWDFTGASSDTYDYLVFMFDFGTTGDGTANSTFLFDDIEFVDLTGGLSQIELPVDFESSSINYALTDFGGNSTVIGVDPTDSENTVAITTKETAAATWAGTTIGTAIGFATAIPFSEDETTMSVRVYSPTAGIQVRLKAEDHRDPTLTVETEATTTVANEWDTLLFDMSNVAPGTNPFNLGTSFDKLSIFFNFGVEGANEVYYFDDVMFITTGPPKSENLALNKTTSASSETQPASNAVDGNDGTRWESSFTDPQWISVDLEQSYSIGQVVLNWEGAYGSQYEIQVSDDNSTWTTIYTETNGDGGKDDIFLTGTGQYIRMYGTTRGTEWGYSLYEFEVYEPMDPSTDATLSDLQIDGSTVKGFSPSTMNYVIELPYSTSMVPTVSATATQNIANAVVTAATSLPGTTTVLVSAADGITTLTYSIHFSLSPPAAPDPTADENNVISVYSDTYTENIATELNPGWGQSTDFSELQIDGNNTLRYANLNYQGLEYTSTNISAMKYVHFDYFTNDATAFEFYLIAGGENSFNIESELGITLGQWVSVDIPLSYYVSAGRNLSAAFQFKTTGNGTIYFDNLYFWKFETSVQDRTGRFNFSIYPNPATNYIQVEASSIIDSIEVFDLSGRKLLSKQTNTKSNLLDVESLNKGSYILRLEVDGHFSTQKFLKQ